MPVIIPELPAQNSTAWYSHYQASDQANRENQTRLSTLESAGSSGGGGGGPSNEVSIVDPRNFLTAGQTWGGVADIRAAFKSALDAAHALTMTDATARVRFIIPSGVGKLTSLIGTAPINRRSSAASKGRITTKAGLPLRLNMAGRIDFVGENESATIQLSGNAQSLFYIDTDAGVTWVDTGRWVSASGTRHKGERPSTYQELRNYTFRNFNIDNNNSLGSYVLIGNRPAVGVDQPYVSVRNVHVDNVNAYNFVIPTTKAELDANNKALVSFLMIANSWHEANAGINGGFDAQSGGALVTTPTPMTEMDNSADYWKDWDLDTEAGRAAAYSCAGSGVLAGGFMWVKNVTVKRSRAIGSGKQVIIVSNRMTPFSVYMDELWVEDCFHDTGTARTYDPYLGQTSFYLGGSIIGGKGGVRRSKSLGIGDDSIEAGGFTHFYVDDFYTENAVLDGLLYVHSQKPLNPFGTTLNIGKYHSKITGDVTTKKITGTSLDHIRGVPVETIVENEGTDGSSAVQYPLGHVIVGESIFEIDGVHWVDGVKTYAMSDGISRAQRMGFAFNYPARKVTFTRCLAIIRGIRITATTGATAWVAGYLTPRIPTPASGIASVHVGDFRAVFEDIVTAGQTLIAIGVVAAASGHTEIENVDLHIINSPAIVGFNVVRLGNRLATTLPMPPSGGTVRVSGATVSVTGPELTGTRIGVRVTADYTMAGLHVEDVRVAHIAGAVGVDTTAGGANTAITTTARIA